MTNSHEEVFNHLLAKRGIGFGLHYTDKLVGKVLQMQQFTRISAPEEIPATLITIADELKQRGIPHVQGVSVAVNLIADSTNVNLMVHLYAYVDLPTIKPVQRTVMHIAVGDADWEPTSEELNLVADLFTTAKSKLGNGVVVTRHGITCTLVEVQETTDIKVVSVHATKEEENKNVID